MEVAEKAELVRAFIWSEGRAHGASAPESLEMAFGVLRLKHDNVIKAEYTKQVEEIEDTDLEHTYPGSSRKFKDDGSLEQPIQDLMLYEVVSLGYGEEEGSEHSHRRGG